jgi:2-polyprenyl-6-hydroxyphenyl methylase / 3-demethylubiquinone-9 3-methyltransferase
MTQHSKSQDQTLFSNLADSWWDPEGPMAPLHHINPIRLDFVQKQINTLKGKNLLDVACGGGLFSESASSLGALVTGIDTSAPLIKKAQAHANPAQKINYKAIDFLQYAKKNSQKKYDIITCFEVLEHVDNPESWLKPLHGLLKPDGLLVVSTLNRTPKTFLTAILGAEYLLNLLPKGTHHYAQCIKPSELTHFARQVGFDLKQISGIQYNPFKKIASLNQDVSVNYIVCLKKSDIQKHAK